MAMKQAAIRGWTLTELAKRAKISRPTIYGWRDNLGIPQAAPVNSAADLLGIPREEALRLAGIITDTEPADRSPPAGLREETKAAMRRDLADAGYEPVIIEQTIAFAEGIASGRIAPADPGAGLRAGDEPRQRGHA